MHEIYDSESNTPAYLGDEAGSSTLGFELIGNLATDWGKLYGVVGVVTSTDYKSLGLPARSNKNW
jgi:hypothetical protein